MERLTTNKDVQEMTMTELAHNCCYAKDRKARYRDFENDVDARDFARKLLKELFNDVDFASDDEDFDEEMLELLQYDTDTIEGLIALFYRNLWAMADLRERLKSYEDAEEQGLLLRLKLKVGDEFWELNDNFVEPAIYPRKAHSLQHVLYCMDNLGKTTFLTYEEAELELANRQQSHAEAIMDERNGR